MENSSQPPQMPIPVEEVEPPKKNIKKFGFVLVPLVILLGIIGIVYFLQFKNLYKESSEIVEKVVEEPSISPQDLSFQELTVPYLRQREYKSSLSEMEAAYDNLNYTAYLTSFDSDGFEVNGLLTVPTGEEPEGGFPAVVFVHGYIPPTEYQTLEKYTDYVDYLARNGFVVFKIDLRGHGQSEGEAGGGYFGSDYVIDTLNAYAALENADFVNKNAIGLWGHSMAGNIIMRSMASKPEIPASVIWAGAVYTYVDMREYGIDDNSYRPPSNNLERQNKRRELFEKHGSPSAQSSFWQKVIPTNYLSDLKGAVHIHHAVNDDVVTIEYSRNLDRLLNEASISHMLYEYESGGHNLLEPAFSQAMERTVEFYRESLK